MPGDPGQAALFRPAVESAPVGVLMVDGHGHIVLLNRELERMLGYAREELLGQPVERLIPERFRARHSGFLAAFSAQPTTRVLGSGRDLFALRKDGTEIPVEIGLNPFGTDAGTYVIAFIADISERKHAEEALRASERRLRTLFETVNLIVLGLDAEGKVDYVNPYLLKLAGYTRDEVFGREWFGFLPEAQRQSMRGVLREQLERGSHPHYENSIVTKAGEERLIAWHNTVIRDEQGRATGTLSIGEDITERKLTEAALSQRARLAELNAEVGIVLSQGESLKDILQRCTQALARHLDAAFARIWTLNEDTEVLELQASAGLYTHLDGPHSRVPVGQFKIGLIAQERRPHLTNSVIGDPRVNDQEWAQREGMVAFAGYPLIVADRIVGVMAVFARHPFSEFVQHALAAVADGIAVGIARKNAEEARRAGHELLHSVIEGANDLIFVKDAQSRIVLINSAGAHALGLPKEEILGRDISSFMPPELAKTIQNSDERVMRDDAPMTEEQTFPGPDGPRTYLHTKVPRHAGGRVVGVLGVAKDITDRKRFEERIRHLTLALEQSPAGVVITDTAGTIQYVNRKFTELTGYSAAEALGKNPRLFKSGTTPPEVYQDLWTKITAGEEWRGVMQNRRKDGGLWWNAATVSPMRDAGGNVTHFLAIQQDVTQQRLLEDQFRQAQKMEAVGRLAGGVAHDFNNLLTVISSYSEMLLDDLPAADQARRDDLSLIKKAATDAAALTRQLLAFSRQQVLEAKVLDLNAIVSGAGKMLQRVIGEDITLALVLAPKLGAVKVDPGQIEQVIMNLAVNARDAMPHGGKLTIETTNVELDIGYTAEHSTVIPGSYVMLVVSDTGVGMDDETKRRIFEPFFTTKEHGKGTGLGLATVYGIVKQSGGIIWVYSEPGKGASFKVYLPHVEESEGERSAEAPPPPAKGTETVLLAEDAASVRAVTRQILERNGYSVLEAPSGKAALAIAAKRSGMIHLLLTDVVMPEMSGRELADQLTALRPELKILFISGYTDDSVVRHGVLESGVAYLQKPFTPDSLARKVREVLDRKR